MPAKRNFLPCFMFLVPWKIKVKNKTQNTLIKWDSPRSEELVFNCLDKNYIFQMTRFNHTMI